MKPPEVEITITVNGKELPWHFDTASTMAVAVVHMPDGSQVLAPLGEINVPELLNSIKVEKQHGIRHSWADEKGITFV